MPYTLYIYFKEYDDEDMTLKYVYQIEDVEIDLYIQGRPDPYHISNPSMIDRNLLFEITQTCDAT